MYAVLVSMAAAGVLAATIAAQQPVDPQTLGPKIGERLIDFSLPDQHGVTRSLRSLVGPKGVVLVFFRSADW
jgi:cytochrome oxidase Cu insertion factor (SCO1/SenC/PrrC family)